MPARLVSLLLVIGLIGGCAPPQTTLKSGVSFDVHAVAAAPGANTIALPDPQQGNTLHLVNPPIVTAANVKLAQIELHGPDAHVAPALRVDLDATGTAAMSAATATPGGMLALVLNGKVIATPKLMAPVSSSFIVQGSFPPGEWQQYLEVVK
jgi:hypothetical protein